MCSMYKVHIQKIADKLKLLKDSGSTGDCKEINGMYDAIKKNGNGNGNCTGPVQKRDALKAELKRFNKVPTETPSFLYYCLTNPVMTIHHVFLGSFGLLVIVVCFHSIHKVFRALIKCIHNLNFISIFVGISVIVSTVSYI